MKQFDFYLIVGLLLICGLSIYIFGFGAEDSTLLQLRISKILCAVLCGGALASAGVMLQNLLKNPLADPYILGTSSGGALGIMAAVLLGYSSITLPFYFFVVGGAFLAILTVCSLGGLSGKSSAVKVILAGVAVNIFLSSVIMLIV
ncbi:MAG: iron ABC transporter permease, partial [Elusimicrobiota bacterium]|nr:iron ABC transporter permease [Elusimicrobiota bacterium]